MDIGDKVKKGDVLATLFVPELVEDFGTKKATVKLDEERIELAQKLVEVADADVKAAEARLDEAKAILGKYQAEVERWDTEVKRLKREVERGVVDPQILLESTNQWKSSTAARDAAKATIEKAEAELLSERGRRSRRPRSTSRSPRPTWPWPTSEAKRIEAWVGYLTLPAPFDGVIVGPQRQHLRLRPARHRRPHGHAPLPPTCRPAGRRADLRGRPHRHRPDLRRHPRAGRQLRPWGRSAADLLCRRPRHLPKDGRDLVVLARVRGALHFRFFGDDGKRLVDTDEGRLADGKPQLAKLKSLLAGLWDRPRRRPTGPEKGGVWDKIPGGAPEISPLDKDKVLAALRAIFGPAQVPRVTGDGARPGVPRRADRGHRHPHLLGPEHQEPDAPRRDRPAQPRQPAPARDVRLRQGDHRAPRGPGPAGGRPHPRRRQDLLLALQGRPRRSGPRSGRASATATGSRSPTSSARRRPSSITPGRPVSGSEKVILGDLSILADGAPVEVSSAAEGEKLASDAPENHSANNDPEANEAGAGTSPQVAATKGPRAVGQANNAAHRTPVQGSPPPRKKPILDQRYPKPEDRLLR